MMYIRANALMHYKLQCHVVTNNIYLLLLLMNCGFVATNEIVENCCKSVSMETMLGSIETYYQPNSFFVTIQH